MQRGKKKLVKHTSVEKREKRFVNKPHTPLTFVTSTATGGWKKKIKTGVLCRGSPRTVQGRVGREKTPTRR